MDFDQTQAIELDFTQVERKEELPILKKVVAQLSIEHDGTAATEFPLFEGVNVIGRQKTNQVFIDQKAMSKLHAIIEIQSDHSALVFDLGSVNKTRKGKVFLQPHIRYNLENHEILHFGNIKAQFILSVPKVNEADDTSETESESMLPKELLGEESESLVSKVSSPANPKKMSPSKPLISNVSTCKANFNISFGESSESESNLPLKRKCAKKPLRRIKPSSKSRAESSDCETDDSLLSSPKNKLLSQAKLIKNSQSNNSDDLLVNIETTQTTSATSNQNIIENLEGPVKIGFKSGDKKIPSSNSFEKELPVKQLTEAAKDKGIMVCATQAYNRHFSESDATTDDELNEQPEIDCEQETQALVIKNSASPVPKIDLNAMTQPVTSNDHFESDSDDCDATEDLNNFHSNILYAETQPLHADEPFNNGTKDLGMKKSNIIETSIDGSANSISHTSDTTGQLNNEIDLNAATQPVLCLSDFDDSDSFTASPNYKQLTKTNPVTRNESVLPHGIVNLNREKSMPIPSKSITSTFYEPGTSVSNEKNENSLVNPNESEILCFESQPVKDINSSVASSTCIEDSYGEKTLGTTMLNEEILNNKTNTNEADYSTESSKIVESSINVFEHISKPLSASPCQNSKTTLLFDTDDELPDISPTNSKLNSPNMRGEISASFFKIEQGAKYCKESDTGCSSPLFSSDGVNGASNKKSCPKKKKSVNHRSKPLVPGINPILVPATQDAETDFLEIAVVPKKNMTLTTINPDSDLPVPSKRKRRERKVPVRYLPDNDESISINAIVLKKGREPNKKSPICVSKSKGRTKKSSDHLDIKSPNQIEAMSDNDNEESISINAKVLKTGKEPNKKSPTGTPKSSAKKGRTKRSSDHLDIKSPNQIEAISDNDNEESISINAKVLKTGKEPNKKSPTGTSKSSAKKGRAKKSSDHLDIKPPNQNKAISDNDNEESISINDKVLKKDYVDSSLTTSSINKTLSISYKKTKKDKLTSNTLEHEVLIDKPRKSSIDCNLGSVKQTIINGITKDQHEVVDNLEPKLDCAHFGPLPTREQSSAESEDFESKENTALHADTLNPVRTSKLSTSRKKTTKKIKDHLMDTEGAKGFALPKSSNSTDKESAPEEEILLTRPKRSSTNVKTSNDELEPFKTPFVKSVKTLVPSTEKKKNIGQGKRTNKAKNVSTDSTLSLDNSESPSLVLDSRAVLDTSEVIVCEEPKAKRTYRKRKSSVLADEVDCKTGLTVSPVLQSNGKADSPSENQRPKRVSKRASKNQIQIGSTDSEQETQDNEITSSNNKNGTKGQKTLCKSIPVRSRKKAGTISPTKTPENGVASLSALENKSASKSRKRSASPDYSIEDKESPSKKTTVPLFNIMFTGFTDEKCEQIIKSLGGEITSDINACTHLVTDQLRRTCKLLCAVAKGIPVLNNKWIESAKKEKTLMHFNNFILKDKTAESRFSFKMETTLKKASEKPLLTGWQVHVTKNVIPGPDQMKDIIECAGANVLPKMPKTKNENMVIVTCKSDLNVCKNAKKCGIPLVSVEFILAGLLSFDLDLDKHAL